MTLCPQLRRLSAEHARWLTEIVAWKGAGEEERCSRLLALWEMEVLPHCRAEEEVLLPELARRLSEADAVIVFTLSDHVALRRLARELKEAARDQRSAAREAFEHKLLEHTAFEERTLFPTVQQTLGCDHMAGLEPELRRRQEPNVARVPPVLSKNLANSDDLD